MSEGGNPPLLASLENGCPFVQYIPQSDFICFATDMTFDLRHLRYFVMLAKEQNFARAAERLHMTQPPLSQQIMQFEALLGVALFVRGKRPLRLTAAGEQLLPEARRLLRSAEAFQESAARMARGSQGALTLGFVMGALPDVLPTLLEAYRAQHPSVQVELREMVSPLQCQALLSGEIDVGVMRPVGDSLAIRTLELRSEDILVALPARHRLAGQSPLDAETLCREPLVSFNNKDARYFDQIAGQVFQHASRPPNVVQVANQLTTVLALVGSGLGLALVPAGARRLAFPKVVFAALIPEYKVGASLVLACRNEPPGALLAGFIDMAQVLKTAGKFEED